MSAAISIPPHSLSIVVPFYNEEDNIAPLVKRVHEALVGYEHPWELVLVDDGSSDATVDRAVQCAHDYGQHVRLVELTRNFKQTAAMQAGIDAARGDVIVTMDGDLQNDPIDIPRMVARLLNEDLDLVAGWRQNRQDGLFLRKIPSKIANRLIARMTGVHLRDYGCSLKAFPWQRDQERAPVWRDAPIHPGLAGHGDDAAPNRAGTDDAPCPDGRAFRNTAFRAPSASFST